MKASVDPRSARDRCAMAPSRIQRVLDMALAAPGSPRQEAYQHRDAPTHLPHGRREPTWGAPRIHGELTMLGFDVSKRTVLRWMRRAPRSPEPAKRWAALLSNHREAIVAMDFFTVPTLTFGVLYCFFVIAHDRERILHCNVTRHPISAWIMQQLLETFPYDSSSQYLILDSATNFNQKVISTVKTLGIEPKRTSFQSPWQNGVAEHWAGNCCCDLLDHAILLNQRHLKRLCMSRSATITKTGRISG
jgi:putative transposase